MTAETNEFKTVHFVAWLERLIQSGQETESWLAAVNRHPEYGTLRRDIARWFTDLGVATQCRLRIHREAAQFLKEEQKTRERLTSLEDEAVVLRSCYDVATKIAFQPMPQRPSVP